MSDIPVYDLWPLVIINSLIINIFAFSFTHPKTSRDWRFLGGFAAFIIALFTEMYGFPLTIYLLSGWLASRYPEIDLLSHDAGHLSYTLLGLSGDPHLCLLHLVSSVFILGGLIFTHYFLESTLYCPKNHALATTGPYVYVRHPQYDAFILIMIGFLIQWPIMLTLIMFQS